MTDPSTTPISRDDLEGKLREVQTGIERRADDAKSTLIPAGIVAGVLLSAIVEIRRI